MSIIFQTKQINLGKKQNKKEEMIRANEKIQIQ